MRPDDRSRRSKPVARWFCSRLGGGPAGMRQSAMTEELAGRRIVAPETRELALLVRMLEERGAECLACPLVAIHDAPDPEPVAAWIERFIATPCDDLILLTGEGLRRLVAFAEQPTSDGVIRLLSRLDLKDSRVGVQLYPDSAHEALLGRLGAAGASVDPVLPYVYASSAEDAAVVAIIDQIAAGKVDAIAFTSAPQVRRLKDVAEKSGRSEALRQGLARIVVAAIGPVAAAELEKLGVAPSVTPAGETYFMKPLVRALAQALTARAGRPAIDEARPG